MKKVYEVWATHGEYSDRVEYTVAIFSKKEDAETVAKTLNAWAREFYDYYSNSYREEEKWSWNESKEFVLVTFNDPFLDNHPLRKYDKYHNLSSCYNTTYGVVDTEFYEDESFFDETPN